VLADIQGNECGHLAESNFMWSKIVISNPISKLSLYVETFIVLQLCVSRTKASNYAVSSATYLSLSNNGATTEEVPRFHLFHIVLELQPFRHGTFFIHLAIFFPRVVVVINVARNKNFRLVSKVERHLGENSGMQRVWNHQLCRPTPYMRHFSPATV